MSESTWAPTRQQLQDHEASLQLRISWAMDQAAEARDPQDRADFERFADQLLETLESVRVAIRRHDEVMAIPFATFVIYPRWMVAGGDAR